MNVLASLALGALFLSVIDANEDVNARNQRQCILKSRKCNVDIPGGLTLIINGDGQLDVDCSTLQENKDCLEDLLVSCEFLRNVSQTIYMRVRIKEYLCDNESAFIRGRDCWQSPALPDAITECGSLSCAMRRCLQEKFETLHECSNAEAGLMVGITDQVRSHGNPCSAQTD